MQRSTRSGRIFDSKNATFSADSATAAAGEAITNSGPRGASVKAMLMGSFISGPPITRSGGPAEGAFVFHTVTCPCRLAA